MLVRDERTRFTRARRTGADHPLLWASPIVGLDDPAPPHRPVLPAMDAPDAIHRGSHF